MIIMKIKVYIFSTKYIIKTKYILKSKEKYSFNSQMGNILAFTIKEDNKLLNEVDNKELKSSLKEVNIFQNMSINDTKKPISSREVEKYLLKRNLLFMEDTIKDVNFIV